MQSDNWVPIQAYFEEILAMTDQHTVRTKSGLIIEDLDFEPVEAISSRTCPSCAFYEDHKACDDHPCLGGQFPEGHPMHGKNRFFIWVRKG